MTTAGELADYLATVPRDAILIVDDRNSFRSIAGVMKFNARKDGDGRGPLVNYLHLELTNPSGAVRICNCPDYGGETHERGAGRCLHRESNVEAFWADRA